MRNQKNKVYFDLVPLNWNPKKCDIWKLKIEYKFVATINLRGVFMNKNQVLNFVLRNKKEYFGEDKILFFNFKKVL